ncbi:MAG: gfo/Idh/MocA family oxidoreductase [Acidobacteria bacterium]|nr:MAG: gfo/Idh/MocA family oxidoreductase [Acidobacteriota bacterium]
MAAFNRRAIGTCNQNNQQSEQSAISNLKSAMFHWGLIGSGDIARRRIAPAMRDSPACELVAVSRARADLAAEFASAFGARRWHARWRDLVVDPEVEGVYVATPVHVHAEQTIAAAEAGKHVLCEKPMAMDAAECDQMIAACRANGVRLGIAYYRRFYPVVQRIKALVASCEIGDPVVAQMTAFEPFDPPPDHPRIWLLDPSRAGGGPMMDFGCHRIEVLLHLFGAVRRAAGVTANVVFARAVEDTSAVVLQFDRGPCATLAVTHAAGERRDTLEIAGSRGSIQVGDLNSGELRIRVEGVERHESHPPAANVHLPLIEDFVDAVAGNRAPAVDGEMGRRVAAVEDEIYAVAPSLR